MKVVLAPVPAVHMQSAVETSDKHGLVAFGSSSTTAWELFNKLDAEKDRIYIYGSKDGDGKPIGVFWAGIFSKITPAVAGRHPDPTIRPVTTDSDGAFLFFYEVRDLSRLANQIPLSRFNWKRQLGQDVPVWPVIATLEDE